MSTGPAEDISAGDTWVLLGELRRRERVYLMVLLLSSNLHLQASDTLGNHPT